MHDSVGALRVDALLEEGLDAVGQRLQHAERPGLVGPHPVLHAGDDLALEPDHQHGGDQQEDEADHDLQDHFDEITAVSMSPVSERVAARRLRQQLEHRRVLQADVNDTVGAGQQPDGLEPGWLNGSQAT